MSCERPSGGTEIRRGFSSDSHDRSQGTRGSEGRLPLLRSGCRTSFSHRAFKRPPPGSSPDLLKPWGNRGKGSLPLAKNSGEGGWPFGQEERAGIGHEPWAWRTSCDRVSGGGRIGGRGVGPPSCFGCDGKNFGRERPLKIFLPKFRTHEKGLRQSPFGVYGRSFP